MKRLLLPAALVPGLVLAAGTAVAENFCGRASPHPVDLAFDAAVARSGGRTVDLVDAQSAAFEGWDRELQRVYNTLLRELAPEARTTLRAAQRAWLAFDTAQAQWDASLHADQGSSTALNVGASALQRRRARACALDSDLEDLRAADPQP